MSDLPAPIAADNSEYITALEARITQLESELQQLKAQSPKLPKTAILNQDFLPRAFAIWGHNFVANFLISLPFLCLSFLIQAAR